MSKFIISAFSDEISPDINEQMYYLKKFGISHFEIRGVNDKNVADLSFDEAAAVKELADKNGISVSSVGSPIGKININDPFEEHLEKLAHVIKLAKILGTDFIRIFSFYIPEGEDATVYRDEVMRRMKAMCALAEKENVILLHENEKGIYGDIAPRCKDILDTVNSPNMRAVFDPANFVECNQITYPDAYDMLDKYITYMHIKDADGLKKIVPSGYGKGNVKEILQKLAQRGYEGFLSIEPHLGQFEGLKDLQFDTSVVNEEKSGPATFKMAHDALVKILDEIK